MDPNMAFVGIGYKEINDTRSNYIVLANRPPLEDKEIAKLTYEGLEPEYDPKSDPLYPFNF